MGDGLTVIAGGYGQDGALVVRFDEFENSGEGATNFKGICVLEIFEF